MFAPLDVSELSEIVSIMDIQTYGEGDIIFLGGDIGDAWYTIFDGLVTVKTKQPFQDTNSWPNCLLRFVSEKWRF